MDHLLYWASPCKSLPESMTGYSPTSLVVFDVREQALVYQWEEMCKPDQLHLVILYIFRASEFPPANSALWTLDSQTTVCMSSITPNTFSPSTIINKHKSAQMQTCSWSPVHPLQVRSLSLKKPHTAYETVMLTIATYIGTQHFVW